jgi:hypothetical protein
MALEGVMAAAGPIVLGVLIAASTFLKWPKMTNYLWAVLAVIWGLVALV